MDKLVKASEPVEVYRLQGRLAAIDDILQLRGDVVKYIKGVADGSMKRIHIGEN